MILIPCPPPPLFLVLYRAQWLMVWKKCSACWRLQAAHWAPFGWHGIMWAAVCTKRQKQLSHLLHSIFICQPAGGEARGDLDPPRRSIFVQQVKLCGEEPPKQASFTPGWRQNPIYHWAERKILVQEISNQVPWRVGGDYCCHLFVKWPQLSVTINAA